MRFTAKCFKCVDNVTYSYWHRIFAFRNEGKILPIFFSKVIQFLLVGQSERWFLQNKPAHSISTPKKARPKPINGSISIPNSVLRSARGWGFLNPPHRLAMGRGTARRVVEGPLRHAAASLWRATSPSQVDGEAHVSHKNHFPTHTPIHYPDSHSVIQAFRHA